jgi:UDP-3-O-[3-hydroxymyristoyl] N-acetylglucosamine deacetylase
MYENQLTIQKKINFEGLGLHSGEIVKMSIFPSEINSGIVFQRTDIKDSEPIKAHWSNITSANLCSKISNQKGVSISTIEHLMFAIYSFGITNLLIKINAPEVPILDGSAKVFVDKFFEIGTKKQNEKLQNIFITKTFEIKEGNKFIKYEPTNNNFLEIDYTIDYNDQLIKKQRFLLKDVQKNFKQVSDCRTFCHQDDLEKIFAMGLAKGGSLDNAIVIAGNKILNQKGLIYKDEFVRHKILDCIGDLYLSGYFIKGKITCSQGGHELTAKLLKKIFSNNRNYSHKLSNVINNYNSKNKLNNYPSTQAVV